ncbi:dihydroorotase [Legionella israelensis]|nr:dihydroorotase [Legionella israelensis]
MIKNVILCRSQSSEENLIVHTITINRPDDWHVHFRDGVLLKDTVPATAKHFARALAMPNLKPPLTHLQAIRQYRENILASLPENSQFTPYMTYYLNESVSPDDLSEAASNDFVLGGKLYPAGATTNSEAGVSSLQTLYPLFEIMQDNNMVLQIHGEVTYGDIFARESLFIEKELDVLVKNFPKLRVVLEHISTKVAADFVRQSSSNIASTITPHHLLYNRNQLLAGGIRPHYYCLPVLKHERDQKALQEAACSGNLKFFAGTDSAPHAQENKENTCGCAGIYSAPYALPLYAQFFEKQNQLDKLNAFMSQFGADFYQLPINNESIELVRIPQYIPNSLPLGKSRVVPIAAGEQISWSVNESH